MREISPSNPFIRNSLSHFDIPLDRVAGVLSAASVAYPPGFERNDLVEIRNHAGKHMERRAAFIDDCDFFVHQDVDDSQDGGFYERRFFVAHEP